MAYDLICCDHRLIEKFLNNIIFLDKVMIVKEVEDMNILLT